MKRRKLATKKFYVLWLFGVSIGLIAMTLWQTRQIITSKKLSSFEQPSTASDADSGGSETSSSEAPLVVSNEEVWGLGGGQGPSGFFTKESASRFERCLGLQSNSFAKGSRIPIKRFLTSLPNYLGGSPQGGRLFKYQNYHLTMSDGEKRFLKVELQKDVEGAEILKLALSRDDHGFPVPMVIPKMDSEDPSEQTIDRYRNLGRVTYEERSFAVQYPEGTIDVVVAGGAVRDLSLSTSKALIDCSGAALGAALNCSCMKIQTASTID
jgi:hypothetical protein